MSDSDDTDVLLLIPPDFFSIETTNSASALHLAGNDFLYYCYEHPQSLDRSSVYNGSIGINSYKSSLLTMSAERSNFAPENCGTQNYMDSGNKLFYSTPIKAHHNADQNPRLSNHVLNEIDHFLQVGAKPIDHPREPQVMAYKSPDQSLIDLNNFSIQEFPSLTASDFNGFNKTSNDAAVPQKPPRKEVLSSSVAKSINARPQMLSLNEIWNNNALNQESSKLQEERLRRQHCERNIQALQAKLLEQEQKLAVAINVDKEKEAMILRLEDDAIRQNRQIRDMELKQSECQERLLQENLELKNKSLFLEKELSETIAVVRKLQDKNELLETKVESLTTASRDVTDIHKNQLRDLEIRLSNSRDSERNLKEQLAKLRKSNEQLKDELEVERKKSEENNKLRADYASLKVKIDNLSRKFSDINGQNDSLKEQINELKSQAEILLEEKKKLIKELDIQRLSLKKYYQSQLEDVVSDKLKEFQKQLSTVEEQLKTEAKKKERLIAERAIKQIELINQTNEQEIKLLSEKYNEQESLYRLQLTNSSKTIYELEQKLSSYQNRRADIAERLHSIMETQWQKALEVLTSPATCRTEEVSNRFNRLSVDHIDKDQLDGVRTLKSFTDNENFHTPVSSRQQKQADILDKRNTLPRDLLHSYIQLLLEKSPTDLKDLDSVLASCKKESKDKCDVNQTNGKMSSGISKSVSNINQLSKTIGKTTRPWK